MPVPPIPPFDSSGYTSCTPGVQNGQAQTLQGSDILQAIITADVVTQQAIAQVIQGAASPTSSGVAQAIGAAQGADACTIANSVTAFQVSCGSLQGEVTTDPGVPETQIQVRKGPPGIGSIFLKIGADILQEFDAPDTITVPECAGQVQAGRLIEYPTRLTPNLKTMHGVYQTIINMLSRLLRCCDPCNTDPPHDFNFASGSGVRNVGKNIFRLNVQFESASDAVNTWFSDPTFKYFGNIRFMDDFGYMGEPQFLNSLVQQVHPDIPNATKYAWNLLYDTQVEIVAITQEYWSGLQFP